MDGGKQVAELVVNKICGIGGSSGINAVIIMIAVIAIIAIIFRHAINKCKYFCSKLIVAFIRILQLIISTKIIAITSGGIYCI